MQPDDAPVAPKKTGFWHNVREWVQVIIVALIIALPIRFFIAEPFVVSGPSMDPTFSSGQFLIVDRLTYDFRQPERGEVIVFQYPRSGEGYGDSKVYYIKRIIGLPGETVSLKDGKVTVSTPPASAGAATTSITIDEPYIESSHLSHDSLPGKTLGSTEYFVMGDNRAQSSDSRLWGPLDEHFIIGRPIVRLSPLNRLGFVPGQYHEN